MLALGILASVLVYRRDGIFVHGDVWRTLVLGLPFVRASSAVRPTRLSAVHDPFNGFIGQVAD